MRRREHDTQLVIVQLLKTPVETFDDQDGFPYSGIVTFALTAGPEGPAKTIFVAPVPARLTAVHVAESILLELSIQGKIPETFGLVSMPIIEISPMYADEIIKAFRAETEDILRAHEIDMLNQMWDLPSE